MVSGIDDERWEREPGLAPLPRGAGTVGRFVVHETQRPVTTENANAPADTVAAEPLIPYPVRDMGAMVAQAATIRFGG